MKLDWGNVLSLLIVERSNGLTSKELLAALAQKAKRKAALRKILKAMGKAGVVEKQANRYFPTSLAIKTAETAPHQTKQSRAERRFVGNASETGLIVWEKESKSILALGSGKRYELALEQWADFLHGDEVGFQKISSKAAKANLFVGVK